MSPDPVTAAGKASERHGLLELAVSAAREAGRMLTTGRPPGRLEVIGTKSSPTDVVTEMDRTSEKLIIERIRVTRPGDWFLGEEGGQAGPEEGQPGAAGPQADGSVRWIIDPIDGTVNYMYGLPDWAVSIAAEQAGQVVAGVVYVPLRDELFTAVRGGGAWLAAAGGTQPLRCAAGVPLAQALVATGFGYGAARRAVQGEVVATVLTRVRDIRRGGSCAVDLCSVAAGRVDAFYERGINYWDRAAGGLIAGEAGGTVAGLRGKPANPELTLAAGPGLFDELHDLLVSLNPERDADA
ncbi:MAG: inositol monophosphatase family protein [Micromonosporaceae bacterium]